MRSDSGRTKIGDAGVTYSQPEQQPQLIALNDDHITFDVSNVTLPASLTTVVDIETSKLHGNNEYRGGSTLSLAVTNNNNNTLAT